MHVNIGIMENINHVWSSIFDCNDPTHFDVNITPLKQWLGQVDPRRPFHYKRGLKRGQKQKKKGYMKPITYHSKVFKLLIHLQLSVHQV
jgi:hypothetical protein